jgi:hypothetical protein
VRAIFDARGAGNVVWNMTYTGSVATWACAVKDLWPGNDLVDWVTWDPYSLDGVKTWDQTVGGFYDWLSANSDPGHDFVSKPWGLGEFGVGGRATRAFEARFYADAKAAVDAGRFPRLKAYVVFDAIGVFETRTDHDPHGAPNLAEQAAYDAFANDPRFLR